MLGSSCGLSSSHEVGRRVDISAQCVYWFIELRMWEEMVCRLGHMVGGSGSMKVISIRLCGIAFLTNTPVVGSEDGSLGLVPKVTKESILFG